MRSASISSLWRHQCRLSLPALVDLTHGLSSPRIADVSSMASIVCAERWSNRRHSSGNGDKLLGDDDSSTTAAGFALTAESGSVLNMTEPTAPCPSGKAQSPARSVRRAMDGSTIRFRTAEL